MILTLMIKKMKELPEGSDLLFLTNAAYIQNFDKSPTAKSANPDLILQCIKEKQRHHSVTIRIVPYHKSPLLIETHDMATAAMTEIRKKYHHKKEFHLVLFEQERLHNFLLLLISELSS